MKAILKFDLDDAFDKEYFDVASHGKELFLTLWDFDQKLRWFDKNDQEKSLDDIRCVLQDIMDAHGVHLDMLS